MDVNIRCFFFLKINVFSLFFFALDQVECKKAQPKEVMLPTNLAKTRASGRTAYGELVVLSGGPSTSTVGAPASSLRYAPYPLPASISGIQHHHHHHQQHHQQLQHHHHHQQQPPHHHQTAHIIPIATPAPSILQYSPSPQQTLYDTAAALSYKRLLAATAATATASLRSHPHHAHHQIQSAQASATPRATATLSYPLSELLGLQPLDMSRTFFL